MNLESKTIRLRLVEKSDADFILKLRLDGNYNQYLSSVAADLQAQKDWISKYKEKEKSGMEFYFIIERNDGVPCGTVRIYDRKKDSFCWGSWILNADKTKFAAIESAFLVYDYGFNSLGYSKSHFDVMKANEKVISFHKKMGAVQVGEDDINYFFEISKESIYRVKEKLLGKLQ